MATAQEEIVRLLTEGAAAVGAGDLTLARRSFERCLEMDPRNADAWFGRALASTSDNQIAIASLERVLALDPGHYRALILRADCAVKAGDLRTAAAFYAAGVRHAPPPNALNAAQRELVGRAEAMSRSLSDQFQHYLQEKIAPALSAAEQTSARFSRSLDLLTGRSKLFLQQPLFYYFPELPQIQFYEREQFSWAAEVEAATDEIRHELQAVMARGGAFEPYVREQKNRPVASGRGLVNNPDWSACFLIKSGEIVEEVANACPATMRAMSRVPLAAVPGRSPSVLFSLLRPGMHIPPHHGFVNTRLIGHLPLIVPPGCALRVGNETREWVEGKLLLFDDTIEHEAWNNSDHTRVVLLFDFWRPELTESERKLVSAMFQAIDEFGGPRGPDWD